MTGCETCKPIRPVHVRGRRIIGFAPDLHGQGHLINDIHYAVTVAPYERRKHGRANVVCACDGPGYGYLGAGVTVVWGKNTKSLLTMVEEGAEKIGTKVVIVALYPGTKDTGGSVAKIPGLLESSNVVYTRFIDECVLEVTGNSVRWRRGLQWTV